MELKPLINPDPIEETLNNGTPDILEFQSQSDLAEITPENSPFSPEEQNIKDAISAQFAALSDRDMLETILHNQISIRGTLEKLDVMAASFQGMKPSDILKKMMGK